VVLERLPRPIVLIFAALSGVGCSGGVELDGAPLPENGAVYTRQLEAVCPSIETSSEEGSALWLQSYDGPEITGVSAGAQGDTFVARAGTETLRLDEAGRPLWSKPYGSVVATDQAGNVYVAGTFERTLTLDDRSLTAKYGQDVFVVELDHNGAVRRAVALDSNAEDEAVTSLVLDEQRNVILSGDGLGTIKLDPDWNVAWRKSFAGRAAVDERGRIWLTGGLTGSQDFGGTTLTSRGGSDVFVVQLAADDGSLLWARSFGDQGDLQRGESIAVRDGAVVVAGTFDGELDFGARALKWSGCSTDAWCRTFGFVVQLAADGSAMWSKSLGPMRAVDSAAASLDGRIALSGALPGGVRPFRQSWLLELDRAGEQLFARAEWPETGIGAGRGVAFDSCGRLLWSLRVRPSLQAEERTYLAKLGLETRVNGDEQP
jgi:hypothetical protein